VTITGYIYILNSQYMYLLKESLLVHL